MLQKFFNRLKFVSFYYLKYAGAIVKIMREEEIQ